MNIYDIAKEAGVSIATVSRVMNGKGNVSEQTRKKIEAVLRKNEYQPSAIARGLVQGSMKTIAILAVDVRVPHYACTSYIMEQQLSKEGYMVLLCNTGERVEDWHRYISRLAERKIDGVILTGSIYNQLQDDPYLDQLGHIPIVMANGFINGRDNIQSVFVDEGRGMELIVDHLIERGRKKIAYVVDKPTESAQRKCSGYLKEMKLHGFKNAEKDVYQSGYGLESGAKIGMELYRKGYDAIMFGEDLTAVGALNELRENGVKIPEEIALTGCNNSEYSYICRPALTTVNNKAGVLSELTVKLLIDLLNRKKETASLIVIPEVVVRQTT